MDGTCIRSAPNKLLISCEQAVTCHSDQRWKTHHYDDKCAAMRFTGSTLEHLGYHVPQTTINRAKSCMFEMEPKPNHHHPNRPIASELENLLVKGDEEDVHCKGHWGSWGACSAEGKQTRVYAVTTAKSGWGHSCGHKNGEKEERACEYQENVNCTGKWSEWSACIDGKKTRTYSVETSAKGEGTCPRADGFVEIEDCAAATTEAPAAADSTLLISRDDLYDALRHVSGHPLIHSVEHVI